MDPTGFVSHHKTWVIGGLVAVVVLYLLLRSPGSGKGGGGTTLYTTGLTGDQAVSLTEAGMNEVVSLAGIHAGEKVNLAGIAAARNVANNQTAANVKNVSTTAAAEEYLGRLALQGIINTNQTQKEIVANEGSTLLGLQPSWESQLLNGPGALNLQSQSGTFLTGASNNFVGFVKAIFGGGSKNSAGGSLVSSWFGG